MPVQGGWTAWSYTKCSQKCFGGTRMRSRNCTNPTPQNGGEFCVGNFLEILRCGLPECGKKIIAYLEEY